MPKLEKPDENATIFAKNENKLNQMLPGNQILKSLELLAKVELADGSVAEENGAVKTAADCTAALRKQNEMLKK